MELDRFMPEHDFRSVCSRRIAADPATPWRAFQELTAEELHITQMLTGIRSLARCGSAGGSRRRLRYRCWRATSWPRCAGRSPSSGTYGPRWPRSRTATPRAFCAEPGWAKTVTGARVVADGDGSLMTIETRVRCTDERSRLIFGAYWLAIRAGGAGLIRLEMLQAVARRVEPVVAAA